MQTCESVQVVKQNFLSWTFKLMALNVSSVIFIVDCCNLNSGSCISTCKEIAVELRISALMFSYNVVW
jgi:hypothetical protein